jgi:hypothetical protein
MPQPNPTPKEKPPSSQRYEFEAMVPNWETMRRIQPRPAAAAPPAPAAHRWQPLLIAGGLVGGLAIAAALRALILGVPIVLLGSRGTFHLLATGVYLVATTLYVTLKTAALHALHQAPLDVQVLAYSTLFVSGLVVLALGIAVLALIGLALALSWPLGALRRQDGSHTTE